MKSKINILILILGVILFLYTSMEVLRVRKLEAQVWKIQDLFPEAMVSNEPGLKELAP